MPTLVIRVVLVQLFGLVGQSGKVDGSFAPTRASSTADSQLAIHPSHLRVYSQIKTQAGLPAIAECQSPKMLTGLPLSQASQLPPLFCVVIVPTLRVGMQPGTLCVPLLRS